jgi:chromosome segregation ATPase
MRTVVCGFPFLLFPTWYLSCRRGQKMVSRTGKRARVDDADKENTKKNGWGGDASMSLATAGAPADAECRLQEMEEELEMLRAKFEEEETRHQDTLSKLSDANAREKDLRWELSRKADGKADDAGMCLCASAGWLEMAHRL